MPASLRTYSFSFSVIRIPKESKFFFTLTYNDEDIQAWRELRYTDSYRLYTNEEFVRAPDFNGYYPRKRLIGRTSEYDPETKTHTVKLVEDTVMAYCGRGFYFPNQPHFPHIRVWQGENGSYTAARVALFDPILRLDFDKNVRLRFTLNGDTTEVKVGYFVGQGPFNRTGYYPYGSKIPNNKKHKFQGLQTCPPDSTMPT